MDVAQCEECRGDLTDEAVYFYHKHKEQMHSAQYCSMACFLRARRLVDAGSEE